MFKQRRSPWTLAALVVAGGLGAVACSRQQAPPSQAAKPANSPPQPALAAAPTAAPTLAAAFAAAYPKATVEIGGQQVSFKPALVERVGPDAFALVSGGQAGQSLAAGHAAFGYASVAYLEAAPKLALMAKPLLINASRGGFGAPPTIVALSGLSAQPTVELISGYGDQGIYDDNAILVSLGQTPGSITVSDPIPIDHSEPGPCDIKGRFIPVTPDKAFDIQFSGAFHGRERFVFAKGGWTPKGAEIDLTDIC